MIMILGGTAEARLLAAELSRRNYHILVTTATPYGGSLIKGSPQVEVVDRPLGPADLGRLILENQVDLVIDATHPYAAAITSTAVAVCRKLQVDYLRYRRPGTEIPRHPLIHWCPGFPEAAVRATGLGKNIFLTTGSKNLGLFIPLARERRCRLVARVLPDPPVITSCLSLGLAPADLIAMQGPFSYQLNLALFREYQADVMVTKDSGQTGGADTKIAAALELNIPVVVVARPPEPENPCPGLNEALARVEQKNIKKGEKTCPQE